MLASMTKQARMTLADLPELIDSHARLRAALAALEKQLNDPRPSYDGFVRTRQQVSRAELERKQALQRALITLEYADPHRTEAAIQVVGGAQERLSRFLTPHYAEWSCASAIRDWPRYRAAARRKIALFSAVLAELEPTLDSPICHGVQSRA